MFAIAAWDRDRRMLVLARDRLGEKPLYWLQQGTDRFAFASELRALRVLPGVDMRIDPAAATALLHWSFVPHPGTIYSGVRQLPPGGLLEVSISDADVTVTERSWWSLGATLDAAINDRSTLTLDEAAEQLEALLADAVAMRLESDVPLGVLPVGGNRFVADLGAGAARTAGPNPPNLHGLDARTRIRRVTPCCDGRPTSRNGSPDGRSLARRCVRPHPATAGQSGTSRSPTRRCFRRRCSAGLLANSSRSASAVTVATNCSPATTGTSSARRSPAGRLTSRQACGERSSPRCSHRHRGRSTRHRRPSRGCFPLVDESRTPATRCRRSPHCSVPMAGHGTRSPRSGRPPTSAPRPPGLRCRICPDGSTKSNS